MRQCCSESGLCLSAMVNCLLAGLSGSQLYEVIICQSCVCLYFKTSPWVLSDEREVVVDLVESCFIAQDYQKMLDHQLQLSQDKRKETQHSSSWWCGNTLIPVQEHSAGCGSLLWVEVELPTRQHAGEQVQVLTAEVNELCIAVGLNVFTLPLLECERACLNSSLWNFSQTAVNSSWWTLIIGI